MLVTLLACLAGSQGRYPAPPKIEVYGWASFGTLRENSKCNWARRYCTLGGAIGFDIEFKSNGSAYSATGDYREAGGVRAVIAGSFSVSRHNPDGLLHLASGRHRWSGAWNYHSGCFDFWERPGAPTTHLWQVLPELPAPFLDGRKPLERPRDVPDNVMGEATRTDTNFGFEADYASVVQSADESMKRAGWTKSTDTGSTLGTTRTCFYEPGPSGRAVVIYKDMSVPDEEFTTDIITGGTRRSGWVALSISCQKKHA